MKITAANIQFKTEYSQHQRAQQRSSHSQQVQKDTATGTNTTLEQQQRFTNYSLNSRIHNNTYSTSEVKNNSEEVSRTITTGKTVSSLLSRFYSQSVELNQTRLSFPEKPRNHNTVAGSNTQFTVHTSKYYEYRQEQSLSFIAEGEIHTEDGNSINFKFYANSQHSFEYQSGSGEYAAQVTRKTDPLVINLQGDFNHLANTAFEFDLDNDGDEETISFAGAGSGFLAIDRNNDGVINNGGELFGPSSGNGFAELAALDEDKNGFIDEGDSAFQELKVWLKDASGNDQLLTLADAKVAAIGVTSGQSQFQINDAYNNPQGSARQTGVFIAESGQVGSVQQIDLQERNPTAENRLKDQFDRGEQQPQTESTNNDIDGAMKKLNELSQALLDRQEHLLELEKDEDAKSLIALIVEKLEEYRKQQDSKNTG